MFDLLETPYDSTPENDGKAPVILVGIDDLRHPDLPVFLDGASADPMDLLVSKLNADPAFRATVAVLEAAQDLKEAATDLLTDGNGEIDERLMAVIDQTLKDAESIVSFSESLQNSVNKSRDALSRTGGEGGSDGSSDTAASSVTYFSYKEDYGLSADVFDFGEFAFTPTKDDGVDCPSLKK
ncbi:hypothetical protein C8J27_10742 [Rhodobacter aestuarii]|uniref:Uncharacterized protein n=1 Tax=Rhodobacter aestuarii TaxID=453582 RepID=A0A1N7NW98_9RHOB|nr:hypothetical protein [Rhodobacter aestuarii]PTV94511.1 hypothetical protein C8J27_10742 [Rhodobacter aestuarii]SIT02572.1 hypothetical protein SAMN05421580_108185 [Rhodobacter aestuarii]